MAFNIRNNKTGTQTKKNATTKKKKRWNGYMKQTNGGEEVWYFSRFSILLNFKRSKHTHECAHHSRATIKYHRLPYTIHIHAAFVIPEYQNKYETVNAICGLHKVIYCGLWVPCVYNNAGFLMFLVWCMLLSPAAHLKTFFSASYHLVEMRKKYNKNIRAEETPEFEEIEILFWSRRPWTR